jgi:hypothetical protein
MGQWVPPECWQPPTQCHNPEDSDLRFNCCRNIKSDVLTKCLYIKPYAKNVLDFCIKIKEALSDDMFKILKQV